MLSLVMLIRLISLLCGGGAAVELVGDSTDAPDASEKVKEESGPMLDLGLSCCDVGRRDSRLIQEPCDENESRDDPSVLFAVATSPCRRDDCGRLSSFGGVIFLAGVGGWRGELIGWEKSGEGCGWS